jgi:hypothetical protein
LTLFVLASIADSTVQITKQTNIIAIPERLRGRRPQESTLKAKYPFKIRFHDVMPALIPSWVCGLVMPSVFRIGVK